MIRLRRAGREQAIVNAIRALNSKGKNKMHTKGEICKKMGIKSTSRIRDILEDMARSTRLVSAETNVEGYADEIAIYGIPTFTQMEIPRDHEIIINGISCRIYETEVEYA